MCNPSIDVIGFCETFLNNTYLDNEIYIEGYNLFRRDRVGKIGGGLVIYCKDGYICSRRVDIESNDIESVWLEFNIIGQKSILICYAYIPPDSSKTWLDLFENQLEKAFSDNKELIVLGDFNIDLVRDCPVKQWNDITTSFNLEQMIKSPTRITDTTSTIIDHIYTTNPSYINETSVPRLALSDHFPVCVSWKKPKTFTKTGHIAIKYRDVTKLSKEAFCGDVSKIQWKLDPDVNNILENFNSNLLQVIDYHAPIKNKRVKRAKQPEWFNENILQAIYDRNKAKSLGDIPLYKTKRNNVLKLIKEAKACFYQRSLAMCKGNSAKLWQCMKTLGVGPTVLKTPKALKTNGNIITKPELIAETFNSSFTDIASNLLSLLPRDVIENEYSPSDTLINYISARLPMPARFNIPLITKEYVYKSILDLNPNKSVGLDEIGARFLHIAAKEITEPLYHIINTSILTSTFPDNWKRARVFAVFKSGSDLDCDHYRPISVLSTLSKIMEKHVHDSFYSFFKLFQSFIS